MERWELCKTISIVNPLKSHSRFNSSSSIIERSADKMGHYSLRKLLTLSLGILTSIPAVSSHDHVQLYNNLEARQASTVSVPTYLPIPATAQAPKLPSTGYLTTPLGDGAYFVTDGVYQALFLVTPNSVIVVDAPPTIGDNLRYAIGNVTSNPVTHLVYSHHHADHIGAARQFTQRNPHLEVIAQANCLPLLRAVNDSTARPLPTRLFEDKYTLRVDNQTLELAFHGENHSPDNIFIWAPVQKVLMVIDIVFPRWAPFYDLAVSSNIPAYLAAHDIILSYPFTTYIGGHLGYAGTRDDVLTQKAFLTDLFTNCAAAITASADPNNTVIGVANTLPPVLAANPGNSWAEFKTWFDTLGVFCGGQTVSKWGGKLAGADVWLKDNAVTAIVSLRLDSGILGPFGYFPS
jgi:glyoxylase-like metal-dependent hydrolase (beta-lactamase superfamily II)